MEPGGSGSFSVHSLLGDSDNTLPIRRGSNTGLLDGEAHDGGQGKYGHWIMGFVQRLKPNQFLASDEAASDMQVPRKRLVSAALVSPVERQEFKFVSRWHDRDKALDVGPELDVEPLIG